MSPVLGTFFPASDSFLVPPSSPRNAQGMITWGWSSYRNTAPTECWVLFPLPYMYDLIQSSQQAYEVGRVLVPYFTEETEAPRNQRICLQ